MCNGDLGDDPAIFAQLVLICPSQSQSRPAPGTVANAKPSTVLFNNCLTQVCFTTAISQIAAAATATIRHADPPRGSSGGRPQEHVNNDHCNCNGHCARTRLRRLNSTAESGKETTATPAIAICTRPDVGFPLRAAFSIFIASRRRVNKQIALFITFAVIRS